MAEGVAEVTYIANFQVLVGRWYRQHQLPLPTPSTPYPIHHTPTHIHTAFLLFIPHCRCYPPRSTQC
jgi:hypothetical protein